MRGIATEAITRGEPHPEFGDLAAKVLAIDAEGRRSIGIVRSPMEIE